MIKTIANFLPTHMALSAHSSFPDENWQWWHRYKNNNSIKYGSVDFEKFPRGCKLALDYIAQNFTPPVECFPDVDYHAGGMHMLPPEGFLGGHYDAEYHPHFKWKRIGSLVLFLTPEWNEDWGGKLLVGDTEIIPEFNRLVWFETDKCWHEVTKVTGPKFRKTIAIFYWKEVDSVPNDIRKCANFEVK